jgi:anti-sigma-K factor RskA
MSMIDKEPERHEIEALLPWYAAGTLSRREADLVERVLACDSDLARR